IYSDQWFVIPLRKLFYLRKSDLESDRESRSIRYRKNIDIFEFHLRSAQSFFNHKINLLFMQTSGETRHYAAIFFVEFDLRRNFIRDNAIILGYGYRGFIAGGIDGEDFHRIKQFDFSNITEQLMIINQKYLDRF